MPKISFRTSAGEISVGDCLLSSYSTIDLRRRAAGTLLANLPAGTFDLASRPARGDHNLNPDTDLRGQMTRTEVRPAAVLIPVIDRGAEATVLFTQRTDNLPNHAGQISFPGGKIEQTDSSPRETALRETEEEVGLSSGLVETLGFLDVYQTGTGFRIAPVLGLVSAEFTLKPDPTEVADVFEVPLRFLMNLENHHKHSLIWRGRNRHYYAIPFGERYIWGATAGIVRMLFDRLYCEC